MEDLKIQYNTACATNKSATIVFQEAVADVERASKEAAQAAKKEKATRTWAAIAGAKLEDTQEVMKSKLKAINKQ